MHSIIHMKQCAIGIFENWMGGCLCSLKTLRWRVSVGKYIPVQFILCSNLNMFYIVRSRPCNNTVKDPTIRWPPLSKHFVTVRTPFSQDETSSRTRWGVQIRKVSNRFTNSARPYQTYFGHSPLISSRSYSPIPIERNPFHTTCLLSEYRFHFYNKICKAAAGCLGLLSETNLWLNMTLLLIFKLITPA